MRALVTLSCYPGSWSWIMHRSTLRRNFAASCATPDHTSNYATCSGTSQHTHSRWTKHTCEPFFLEAESNFERVNLDSSTSVLRQQLLSYVHTAAPNADSPQHRAAGWRFIDWRWSSVSFSQKQNVFWRRENCFHKAQPRSLTRQMPRPKPPTASQRRT